MSSTYRGLQHNCIRYKSSGNEAAVHSQWNKFIVKTRSGSNVLQQKENNNNNKRKKPEQRKETLGTRLGDKS